jgi:hypothetical protein
MLSTDYRAPPFLVDTVNLDFILGEDVTHVHSRLSLVPNYDASSGAVPELVLNGRKDVKLVSLKVGREAKGWSCASQAHSWWWHLLLPSQNLHSSCWALGRAVDARPVAAIWGLLVPGNSLLTAIHRTRADQWRGCRSL